MIKLSLIELLKIEIVVVLVTCFNS